MCLEMLQAVRDAIDCSCKLIDNHEHKSMTQCTGLSCQARNVAPADLHRNHHVLELAPFRDHSSACIHARPNLTLRMDMFKSLILQAVDAAVNAAASIATAPLKPGWGTCIFRRMSEKPRAD